MPFVRAGPAEILRASQKDETAIRYLQERLEKLLIHVVDVQTFIKHKNVAQCFGQFLFYLNTTLGGLQTLGEEYTGIVQVNSSLRRLPPKPNLWLMVILECLGPSLFVHFQKSLNKKILERKQVADEAEKAELNFVVFVLKILPLFSHLHKALFYYSCGTYQLSKRIAGIHYVLVRFWLKDRQSIKGFRLLGLVSILQLLTLFFQQSLEAVNRIEQSTEDQDCPSQAVPSAKQCVICVENISSPTATPCGHIFCWHCITEWAQNEERCPVCRETVVPHRLVPLRNYI
uniref:RING-type E3 ubiquitin transferase n=1 Tax=Lygus hesperus TaxID=30085 RepID=A0A0K8THW6_LYGHE